GASMNPARTLGPDIVAANFTGWWVYVIGDLAGAAIAVIIIMLVRGTPDKAEREAAEGGALPIAGADGQRPSPWRRDRQVGRRDLRAWWAHGDGWSARRRLDAGAVPPAGPDRGGQTRRRLHRRLRAHLLRLRR